jgi:hypothetical protein
VEPADELIELLQRAGLRQAEMTDVVVDLHLVVIDPERMVDVPWHLHQLLLQHRKQVQAAGDMGLVDIVETALEAGR